MDKEWAELNKKMQNLLNKEETFVDAINVLIELRLKVFEQITQIVNDFPKEAFFQMPFINANGYHSKTLSYSIWHIFRIEDIVVHELIEENEQILFAGDYVKKINSPIITTGNELQGKEIEKFSKVLDRVQLYNYAKEVLESTNEILKKLNYKDLKKKFGSRYEEKILTTKCVSEDKNAIWLVNYWCSKDLKGLIKMPLSRHHIMHVEAMRRIKNKLCKNAKDFRR